MRILFWYWGRRGAGGQLTQALAAALARRSDVSVALSLSAQAELLEPTRALGLPELGRIAVGAPADLCLWDIRQPAELAYAVQPGRLRQRIFCGEITHAR